MSQYEIIVLDLDGTLTNRDKAVSYTHLSIRIQFLFIASFMPYPTPNIQRDQSKKSIKYRIDFMQFCATFLFPCYKSAFEYIPVESHIGEFQDKYYDCLLYTSRCV